MFANCCAYRCYVRVADLSALVESYEREQLQVEMRLVAKAIEEDALLI